MAQRLKKQREQRIIERLRELPSRQLEEVLQFIDFVAERRRKGGPDKVSTDPKCSIAALRGRGKGEHLVEDRKSVV